MASQVATGATLLPLDSAQAILSPPVIALTLLGLLLVPLLILALFKGPKLLVVTPALPGPVVTPMRSA